MAQINPAAYPTRYKISVLDSPAEENISIEFSDDLATLLYNGNLTMEDNMDGSNSYCGFDPTQHDYWVGGSIYSSFIADPNNIVNGRIQFNSRPVQNNKQNLRWFLRLSSSGGNASSNTLRWTPQVDGASRTPLYNRSATMSMISQMTNDNVNVTNGSTLLYDYYPVTNINLDKIAIRPTFTVIRYAPTYTDDVITSISTSGGTNYYWEQIKPEDKTPAGTNYNEGLWTNGFYDVMDENDQTKIKYRYILNACTAQTYYGTKAPGSSGSVLMGLRVDQSNWNADGDRQLPTTGFSTVYGTLVPYSEGYFDINGVTGVMLNGISGIRFSNTVGSYSNKDRVHFDVNYNDDLYFQNVTYQGTTMASNGGLGTITLRNNSDYRAESFVQMSYGLGGIFAADEAPNYTRTHYTFHSNGAITQSLRNSSTRSLVYLTDAPYSLQSLWAALASLGVYVAGYNTIPSTLIIGTDFPSTLYHGEVLADGTTTGVMIQGDDIEDLPTWDTIDYQPVIPSPNPPSGDDSGGDDIRPSDWTNLRIGAANNFVTLYGMTSETVSDFGRKMWAQLADPEFWQMVGTAFTNDFSINPADMMRYFVSLRYFPFDVSDFAYTTSSGVYIGRAASPIAPSIGVAYPIRLSNSVVQVSGGSLTISRYYNDYRDYDPCTTVQVHVPFCGSVEIPASEVMGHTLDLTYKIDLQTGAMLAVLCVQSNTYYVIATLAGTVGASIPITANNNIEFLQRIATIGGGLIGGGVSGALKGAMLGGEVGAVVGAVAGTVGGGVGALAGLPPVTVHKQGNASGFANLGGVPYAYATIQHSRFELPDNYGHTTGYACDFAAKVSDLAGYTVCDNVDTSGLSCNSRERDEIKRLLESGVYV